MDTVKQQLETQLDAVAFHFRLVIWWRSLGIIFLATALVCLALIGFRSQGTETFGSVTVALMTIAAVAFVSLIAWRSCRLHRETAHTVEAHFSDLDDRLITALDECERSPKSLSYLQQTVVQETLTHARHNPWWNIIPKRQVSRVRTGALASMLLCLIGLARLQVTPVAQLVSDVADSEEFAIDVADYEIKVEPGDTELELGRNLVVLARFGKHLPQDVELVVEFAGETQRIPMIRSLQDPLFGGTFYEVKQAFNYHIAYDERKSADFHVDVFTYPALVRADALLDYPGYTGVPEKLIEDTRRVSAVEGTQLTWKLHLNKPIRSARLVPYNGAGGNVLELLPDPRDPLRYAISLELKKSTSWQLQLIDEEGRQNKSPPRLTAKVVPNQPPKMKLELAHDARVSPLEEFPVKATISDDHGLRKYGLTFALADADPQDVVLGEGSKRREQRAAAHVLDFESLKAELISYFRIISGRKIAM